MRPVTIFALNAVLTMTCLSQAQGVKSGREDSAARSTMIDVLKKAPFSGSLEYSGRCGPQPPPILPAVRPPRQDRDSSSLGMLREIFADEPEMQVTQEPDGTIRMVDNNLPKDLLQIRVSRISFKDTYDPIDAQSLVLSAPEVRSFMDVHGIRSHDDQLRFHEMRGLHQEPQPGFPYISENLENVTVQQAMDRLLKTFPGFWVYENCPGGKSGRVVAFDYFENTDLLLRGAGGLSASDFGESPEQLAADLQALAGPEAGPDFTCDIECVLAEFLSASNPSVSTTQK
jgi:hypothetical protein